MFRCLIVVLVHLGVADKTTENYKPLWNYDDESNWPGVLCQKGGMKQSPIDIQTTSVIFDYKHDFIKYGRLQFVGYEKVLLTGINNGHTVQFSTEGDESMHPSLTGGPLQHQYRLEQLHFHWLSEHAVDGNKFPMEIHLVHVRSDLAVVDALQASDGLAIVAIFCNVRTELELANELSSDEMMQHISRLLETGDRVSGVIMDINYFRMSIASFDELTTILEPSISRQDTVMRKSIPAEQRLAMTLRKLLSPNRESYFTYAGSLTSPGCNEAVIWIIFDTPISISDTHYRLFGKIGVGRHNFRRLQRLTHHLVFRPPDRYIQTPQLVKMVNDVFGLVAQIFRNASTFVSNSLKKH